MHSAAQQCNHEHLADHAGLGAKWSTVRLAGYYLRTAGVIHEVSVALAEVLTHELGCSLGAPERRVLRNCVSS